MSKYIKGSEWRKWDLHIHTASSYDAYKGVDSDVLLCKTLKENEISVVAITDHFCIDSDRILKLRKIEPNITFLPGVELRTDKGAANLHLILIFSEKSNLSTLASDFEAVMLRQKAKAADKPETIYWTFEDIVEFAHEHNGIISIHAGKKERGIDKEITNATPVKEAIKEDIAKEVHFFEIGKKIDISDYYEHVFKFTKEKPLIMCSDNHNPKEYSNKETLWIKADPCFDGLIQCIYQPKERVYIGDIPPKLDKANKNKSTYIKSIFVKRKSDAKNSLENWFDLEIPINCGLTAIIGNKGTGKSALSDIIGHFCNSKSMSEASFLNTERFRKQPQKLADDYEGGIIWLDGQEDKIYSLSKLERTSTIENAQYLPQKYIEKVCNELGDEFQMEINNVIFSYVDETEKGDAKNLIELIDNKCVSIFEKERYIKEEISEINKNIIYSEQRLVTDYLVNLKDNLKKRINDLERQEKNKPYEVKKPEFNTSPEYEGNLKELEEEISITENEIEKTKTALITINKQIDLLNEAKERITKLINDIEYCNLYLGKIAVEFKFDINKFKIVYSTPNEELISKINFLKDERKQKQLLLDNSKDNENKVSLYSKLTRLKFDKDNLISKTNSQEKAYQKYLSDIKDWEKAKKDILGDSTKEGSIENLKHEINYIENELPNDYNILKDERIDKIKSLFELKKSKAQIYESIYKPIQEEIEKLFNDKENIVKFEVSISMIDKEAPIKLLNYISKSYSGIFSGKTEAQNKMNEIINNYDFNKLEDVCNFINEVLICVYEDIDISAKKVKDKEHFYEYLTSLDYIDAEYTLKMGDKGLKELSAGQRGIVLLMFYLALSKNEIPIIIDQPEDNLDNQSVFGTLVPCIQEAKKKRQIIIVTHNPNIAIACDAEQIICCSISKKGNKISYESGSIENSKIRERVIKILEGTMPAFNLRELKYTLKL